jgi:hypothetical protein
MACKKWSQPDGNHWRSLCSNKMYPETGTEGCQLCLKPVGVSTICGGPCFEGSPPASVRVSISGSFVAANGTDLSGFTGEFGLQRVGVSDQCCVYVGKSPNMRPYVFNSFGQVLEVKDQLPDMEARLCAGGSGYFRLRIAGRANEAFFSGSPGQPAGFTWDISPPDGHRTHQCKSPWALPRVNHTPGVSAGPSDSSVLFIFQVTPPPSVTLWW